jgi:hypothetical protein
MVSYDFKQFSLRLPIDLYKQLRKVHAKLINGALESGQSHSVASEMLLDSLGAIGDRLTARSTIHCAGVDTEIRGRGHTCRAASRRARQSD